MSPPEDIEAASSSSVLVRSSQKDNSTPIRPHKRRRINLPSSSEDSDTYSTNTSDDYDLPSNDLEDFEGTASQKAKKQAEDDLIRRQIHDEAQQNVYVTQITQPWSSPTRIRGPRWKKKTPTPSLPSSPQSPPSRQLSSGGVDHARSVMVTEQVGVTSNNNANDEFDDDEIDALMADQVFEPRLLEPEQDDMAMVTSQQQAPRAFRQTTLFGINTIEQRRPTPSTQARTHNWPLANRDEKPTHHKLNREALDTWTYPLNVGTIRDYQYNIVYKSLFHNVLVALPTGLGKTFIAATVMLNWFRWTENSQIVFMAPTKPLVAQQIDACFHIAGIPRSQTTLLTGEVPVPIRTEEWQEKRVFFMTPQTFINDLQSGIADPRKIVLVVVDEAHKASGGYAYVTVVNFLRRFNTSFRLLALTATPGSTVESVQKVIDSLGLARVEIRTEESLDIRQFVHHRDIDLEFFNYSEEIQMCLENFGLFTQSTVDKLCSQNAFWGKDPTAITLFGLMKARQQWTSSEAGRRASQGIKGMIHACFTPLMSLAHNLELLKYHGIGPFYHKMKEFEGEASGKYAKAMVQHPKFKEMMDRIRIWINDSNFVGHPKLAYLNTVVLNHFMDAGDGHNQAGGRAPSDTRIMVFAHYRDSAEEITRTLNRHAPMVKAHIFVGQSGKKGKEGMDQKTQIDIIKKFKAGTYNTIVATSIGEEGLDIGEVDLIVCYDCSKSPIRMLQRMGRTGRKRAGKIVMLLMRGKEEKDYYSAKDNYTKIQQIIEQGREFNFHEDQSPRILPKEITPVVEKRHIEIPIENTQGGSLEPKKRKVTRTKKPPKRFNMPDDVETGFRFLGGNKKGKNAESRKKAIHCNDRYIASLPELQAVMLSVDEERDLENHYAQVSGTEPQFIQILRLENQPEKLYGPDRTALVGHSHITTKLIQASKSMRELQPNCTAPDGDTIISQFSKDADISEHTSRIRNSYHKADKDRSLPTVVHRTTEDENEYDSDDSFIDNGPLAQIVNSAGTVSRESISKKVCYALEDDEEIEMPDMGDLIRPFDKEHHLNGRQVHPRNKRRVLSDDDDD